VFGVMDGRVDLVLEGGMIGGVGATTVDITEAYWKVIREGAVAERDIAEVLRGT
jgi:L-threonylcarbamoyladenylate synthase